MAAAVAVEAVPLPTRLINFFARYPPKLYSAKFTGASYPLTKSHPASPESQASSSLLNPQPQIPLALSTSSEDPNNPSIERIVSPPLTISSLIKASNHNPFLPWKNPETGHWRGAAVPLRRQADLVKLAKKHGIEELLPPGRKSTEFKEQRILEKGLRVKGTGEGQKVKGHKWERTMNATLEKRRKAMEEMPEMIRLWKQVSSLDLRTYLRVESRTDNSNYSEVTEEVGRNIQDKTAIKSSNVQMYLNTTVFNIQGCCFLLSKASADI